ncbi:MAG TPA: glycosyltransferase [Candidatus Saccharimonadales bacterium]|nr:glycosyltransferase [Candidatus Saccharimonadales bacterium]
MDKQFISIIVPTWNEEGNVKLLVERIHTALLGKNIGYEMIFIDDHSTDKTVRILTSLSFQYPLRIYTKRGVKGKAQSLLEGFKKAKHDVICMIDADLQYPPEAIPDMTTKVLYETDIVIGNRIEAYTSLKRKIASKAFNLVFAKALHGFHHDVQSGLKVFKKEIIERFELNPTPWGFDLEFLIKARNAGYTISTYDIIFSQRYSGKTKIGLAKAAYETGFAALKLKFANPEIIPFHPSVRAEKGNGFHFKGNPFVSHSDLPHEETALYTLNTRQKVEMTAFAFVFVIALLLNWHLTIVILLASLTLLYFSDLLFNMFLVFRSFQRVAEIQVSQEEITASQPVEWPMYTIYCPLYKEWEVLPQFVKAMSRLDYPKDKLQIILLLEEDDQETVEKARGFNLPANFEILVVPHSKPKTKPKAMNYGLMYTRGEYVVVYDAEDVPERDQLKKAVIAFQKLDSKTICIQAKLNFYNPNQNILTRAFTAEYSLWFDLTLPGLQSITAPIPLGGTSNHFKTKNLRMLKGWDAFNVTEDCDLGLRLVKQGYKTAILDSTTHEEANSDLMNWFWQRTRWVKGYMQTYLINMRNPKALWKNFTEPHFITFQLVVGGKFLSALINPIMWIITIIYFLFRAKIGLFIESFFPGPVLYMGVFSLVIGNFFYMYNYMIGCTKRGYDDIVKYVYLVPVYWLVMSAASYVALYKLIRQPHFWSKTKHGLHLNNQKAMNQTHEVIGTNFTEEQLADYTLNPAPVFQ